LLTFKILSLKIVNKSEYWNITTFYTFGKLTNGQFDPKILYLGSEARRQLRENPPIFPQIFFNITTDKEIIWRSNGHFCL